MKHLLSIALVLAIAASCTYASTLRRDDIDTLLTEMSQDRLGSTVMSLVSIHLSSKGPLDTLITLLGGVIQQTQKDQKGDDDFNSTTEGTCQTIIGGYESQIIKYKDLIRNSVALRDLTQQQLTLAEKDLRDTIASLNLNQERISAGQIQRDNQHKNYQTQYVEHQAGIHGLDGALQLLSNLKAGASFIQVKKKFDAVMTELIETSKSSSKSSMYSPLIEALAQLAESASPEVIARIQKLFNDLRGELTKGIQAATVAEGKEMESWTSLKADLLTEEDQLTEKRRSLEGQCQIYRKVIAEKNKDIEGDTKTLGEVQANLKSRRKSCQALSDAYRQRTEGRKRDIKIITKIIGFFQSRAKATVDFINKQTANAKL